MMYYRYGVCFVLAFIAMVVQARADFTGSELESSAFDYKYEMDVAPSSEDLDFNTINDFSNFGTNPVSGGILMHTATAGDGNAFDGQAAGSIWPTNLATGNFTMEWSAQVLTQDSGPDGQWGSFLVFGSNDTRRAAVVIGDSDVQFRYGAENIQVIADSVDNTGAFHTFRVALSSTSPTETTGYVWRDDVLIHEETYNASSFSAATWFGDYSGNVAGTTNVDYLRITSGAFGPVTGSGTGPGDFDMDGDVDGADFLKWQRGELSPPLSSSDLDDWKANFGPSPSLFASVSVPEPSSLLLGVMPIVALLCTRRKIKGTLMQIHLAG